VGTREMWRRSAAPLQRLLSAGPPLQRQAPAACIAGLSLCYGSSHAVSYLQPVDLAVLHSLARRSVALPPAAICIERHRCVATAAAATAADEAHTELPVSQAARDPSVEARRLPAHCPSAVALLPFRADSVKRKRKKAMNRHKQRKLRKRERNRN
jgi:hypothetical protein